MRHDIIVDSDDENDLVVYAGDFFVGYSDAQHIAHIVEADAGQYRQHPLLGVGLRRFINGVVDGEVRRRIQLQLVSDGYRPRRVVYEDEILKIEI